MGRRPRTVAQPRPVKLSEWVQHRPGQPVTRVEAIQVVALLVERRLQVEREIERQRKWYRRLWKWFTWIFAPSAELTEAEIEHARQAALDPEATSTELPAEPEPADAAEEGGVPVEETESGVKVRDRRTGRPDA